MFYETRRGARMHTTESKPVLFIDFDGTLCFERFWSDLPEHTYRAIQDHLFSGDRTVTIAWMRGQVRAEDVCY